MGRQLYLTLLFVAFSFGSAIKSSIGYRSVLKNMKSRKKLQQLQQQNIQLTDDSILADDKGADDFYYSPYIPPSSFNLTGWIYGSYFSSGSDCVGTPDQVAGIAIGACFPSSTGGASYRYNGQCILRS